MKFFRDIALLTVCTTLVAARAVQVDPAITKVLRAADSTRAVEAGTATHDGYANIVMLGQKSTH